MSVSAVLEADGSLSDCQIVPSTINASYRWALPCSSRSPTDALSACTAPEPVSTPPLSTCLRALKPPTRLSYTEVDELLSLVTDEEEPELFGLYVRHRLIFSRPLGEALPLCSPAPSACPPTLQPNAYQARSDPA